MCAKGDTEVASADLGDQAVEYFLNGSGYDKPSSTAPCAGWIMKTVCTDDKKGTSSPPLLKPTIVEATVKFSVP